MDATVRSGGRSATAHEPEPSFPGKYLSTVSVQKIDLPDGKTMLYGRAKRVSAGPIKISFDHRFLQPKDVVVLVNANFTLQAGFVETVTRIEADHFVVTSNNAHWADAFVSWMAVGK